MLSTKARWGLCIEYLGAVIGIVAVLRLFGLFSTFIKTDQQWFFTILMCFFVWGLGAYVSSEAIRPKSHAQVRRKEGEKNMAVTICVASAILIITVLFAL